jgi:hypothetical protein
MAILIFPAGLLWVASSPIDDRLFISWISDNGRDDRLGALFTKRRDVLRGIGPSVALTGMLVPCPRHRGGLPSALRRDCRAASGARW